MALINGKEYSWSQISINILGVTVTGVKSINYSESQEIINNMGAGVKPVSQSDGAVTFEGSIELYMSELEALQQAAPGGRIQAIPAFDVIVAYIPDNGGVVSHRLISCRFLNNGREAGSDSADGISYEVNLLIGDISWIN